MYRNHKHTEKQSYTKFKRSLIFALLAGGAIGANLLEGIVPVCANRRTRSGKNGDYEEYKEEDEECLYLLGRLLKLALSRQGDDSNYI